MANLSAMGTVYRTFTAALGGLVDQRVQSYRAASNEELPYIEIWSEQGGAAQRAPGTRDYEFMVAVLGTDKMKTDALTLQEGISRALWDRGTEDRHYDAGGPFAPLSGDVYRVQTISEGRSIDDFTFNPDDSLRAPNNGAYYTVTVTERD